ncbi:RNA polymerase sigma factor SigV [Oxobacter pfennigii]|uniref:RNA polymerase sigma factor SigV n=1 Tax=Oxobacter pfennigii TaxID=36849 RepID=A0A0P8WQJ5_9CLOT|nr:sigma-70 family RNA polymerase sigma factor [Oxobacter pfennigii]KPU44817.1 RNA polymerase sigma factor SigV [Oxobacter pfennigii]
MNLISLKNQLAEHVIEYREKYYRLAYSHVKNIDDAMDIVQESIYKAISTINTLKEPSYIRTWFYRIVVNTSLDFLRKQKRLKVVGEDVITYLDSGITDTYENIDLSIAIDTLPDICRSIIILRYFEDLKLSEIAEILNENINTVKTHLYKSLEKLRLEMIDLDEEV